MEGRVPISTSDTMYQRFKEGKIYHIRYFNLLPNNRRYMLTVQPYIININETTIITLIQGNISLIPSYIFRPQRYPQLISLESATNFLPCQKKTIPITHTNKFSIFVAKNKLFSQMLLAAYASSKEVIYITTTQIQKSSLDCVKQ